MPSSARTKKNGKMSEYHAAVGLAELDGWAAKLAGFRAVAEHYRRALAASGLAERLYGAPDIGPSYALFRCRGAAEAERAARGLGDNGIDVRLWYGTGLHHQTYYSFFPYDPLHRTLNSFPTRRSSD